ncbi:adenosylhomocysteine nucleosidase [bacterium A37T11]|nr:adenosylhomocysteine nucleosidase [bacterium A37T11]
MEERIVGIMGAMHEEIHAIVALLEQKTSHVYGMRTYYTGTLGGINVVVVFSRWGKVAAATTVSSLILKFKITELFFIGVAGGISPSLKIGDIVIATQLLQHDMDARPLMPRYEVPLLEKTYFEGAPGLIAGMERAVGAMIATLDTTPVIWKGTIASGDKFFAHLADKESFQKDLSDVLCVEMEGAAVAQVCYEYAIPFVVVRIISDEANDQSHTDFQAFIEHVSSRYAAGIFEQLFL